jgi:Xaa-Pro aminopeptidase
MSKEAFTHGEMATFKEAQKLAYEAVAAVESQLYEGITEKQAARMIEDWLRERGVKRFFHYGFAWFGERTRFKGLKKPDPAKAVASVLDPRMAHFGRQFLPTDRKLKEGEPVILDVAPVLGRIPCDIGYCCMLGRDEVGAFHKMRMDLEPYRELILRMVQEGRTQQRIYAAVDELIADQGYENIHAYYPGAVLAHRVGSLPWTRLPSPRVNGFSIQAVSYLVGHLYRHGRKPESNATPIWNHDSDRPCEPGLWAVEPHIGKGDLGVKWEELLVVTEDGAHWLDDDLPHVRYWKEHRN